MAGFAWHQNKAECPLLLGLPRMHRLCLLFCVSQENRSSSGTPHKRDSFIYSTWLDDSLSTTSGGSSPGSRCMIPLDGPFLASASSWESTLHTRSRQPFEVGHDSFARGLRELGLGWRLNLDSTTEVRSRTMTASFTCSFSPVVSFL